MNKTISEKKAFLEEIIPLAADPSRKDEIQQKHYDFLLQDTNGGKMYKYRSFDSHGYALNSLIRSTALARIRSTIRLIRKWALTFNQ